MENKRIAVISLGCNKNLVDTENMLGLLGEQGYVLTSDESQADILLVNTCGFIESSKDESIQAILEMVQYKEENQAKLIVTGCLAQRYPEELMKEIPEIDGLVGTAGVPDIVTVVEQVLGGRQVNAVCEPKYNVERLLPRVLSNPGFSAYVKIAEGCNNRCAFCAIPNIRGRYTSKPMDMIVSEVEQLVADGIKEIILVAQDTTRYGIDLYGQHRLPQLIEKLVAIEGLAWLRILYCYPTDFTDELIDTIAEQPKVCKYIDLPLQHASDKILKQMHRRGSVTEIKTLISKLRKKIPNLTLRTSFIVGFPGEEPEDFQQLLDFMQEIRFDRVGVFKYSQEEGTPAADMPQINELIKEERYHSAMQLQQRISLENNQKKVGQVLAVLTEGEMSDQPGTYVGRSQGDAPEIDGLVYFKAGRKVEAGEIIPVKITEATEYDLIGVLNE